MAAPVAGVCTPWITAADVSSDACADMVKRGMAALFAVNVLYRLSGRQYPGVCERTIRPCGVGCASWARWPAFKDAWAPVAATSQGWTATGVAIAYAGCSGTCHLPSVTLPGPVANITQVVIDGDVLDPAAYQVINHRRLQRLDGGTWPCSQNLAADSGVGGDPGTFQVTYTYGRNPGPEGIIVATEYANEVAKHLCGAADCRLPERTRTVARQGITFELSTPLDFLDDGRTGVPLVDLWLRSVNPAKLPRRATVRRFDEGTGGSMPAGSGASVPSGSGSSLNEAEVLALIAAHPDVVKVTYKTVAVSGVGADGWYRHNGTLASFTGRTWTVIWEGTAGQIPGQGTGDAQFQTGDLAITRISTL